MTPHNLNIQIKFYSKHLSDMSIKLHCVINQEMTILASARTSNLKRNQAVFPVIIYDGTVYHLRYRDEKYRRHFGQKT